MEPELVTGGGMVNPVNLQIKERDLSTECGILIDIKLHLYANNNTNRKHIVSRRSSPI